MQSLSTFIRLSGSTSEAEESALINDYDNIIAYWEKCSVKRGLVWFVPNKYGGLRIGATPEMFSYFFSHLGLETAFPALSQKIVILT